MSQLEFEMAQKQLLALTRQMAEECTQENYDRVINRLVKLKTDGILNKVYWALCHRAFAALYPSKITNVVNVSNFFSSYNYCNNHFQLGLSEAQSGSLATLISRKRCTEHWAMMSILSN